MIRDTIYNDLKEQGLLLSSGAVLQLPPIRPPPAGILRQVGGIFASQFSIGEGPFRVITLPVLNSAVLIARANTLICYKFELNKQTAAPIFAPPKIENLSFVITALHICDSRFLNDRGEVPFIVEGEDRIVLFYVDLKEFKLIQKNSMSYSKLFSIRFLCEKEVLLLTRELEIHHYTIQNSKLKMKNNKISADFPQISKDQYVHHCRIVGNIDEEQDSTVALFYLIKKRKEKNFQVLKVKEYLRSFEGKIEAINEDYTVMMNLHSSVLPQNFQVWWSDGFYCIETKHQILILKKKFKKYLFIDNIMQKIHDHNLRYNQGAIISSYGKNAMQLSVIQFGDPKCYSKILDTIQIEPQLLDGFRMLWPFKNQKQTCLMFMFGKEKKLVFHNVIKMEPMKKMLDEVKKCDKSKISVIQQIAVNLGINKKDFYLTLWQSSKREIPDIYQFLLPCGDVSSIKKEIRLTMRRKKIVVTDFLKILEKITLIIRHELKTNLSQQMLKEYIKNDFLLRKIKLKDKNKRLDHRDLDKVYNSSLIDMFVQIIKNELYPQKKEVDPLHAMVDEPEKEVMKLSHVFQQFRIVILENYKKFIVDLLSNFSSQQIVNVMRNFDYLLPIYPFEINIFMHESEYKTEVELNLQMERYNNTGVKQNLWFMHMTSIEFNRELSKERIERQLHEYYPTSKITDAINTLVNSNYATQKLRKHGLISGTIEEYKNKLKDLHNIKLFMKVCQYANQTNPYSDEDLSSELVDTFSKNNHLNKEPYETVKLYASMHKFMLKNDFCQKKTNQRGSFTTQELLQFTSEDLVALFFLQNRQRKEFIFNDFRNLYVSLYSSSQQFNSVIQKFINSENCSRIQLEIFIKEILNQDLQFQIDNQALIELLIDGFCKKLQIREDTDTKHFIELMEEIELNKDLGMKINKIMQVRKCLGILNVFECQKFTYYRILAEQKDNMIFKILLDRYFNQQIKRDSVRIEDEEIYLDVRNMLTVLIYILETIYYDVSLRELLLTYGEVLIEWKQFDIIKLILYGEDVLQKLSIDKISYVNQLVRNALHAIYTDQTIEFDQEVKNQIEDILDILQQSNHALKSQEYAKLKLVEIFEKWEVLVHPFDIYTVCEDWNWRGQYVENGKKILLHGNGRQDFITSLFDVYLEKLTFETLEQIYTYLQLTDSSQTEMREVQLNNSEYVKLILTFAQRLLKAQRYSEIIEIFAFVKKISETTIEYELLTQSFLKQVCLLYPDSSQLSQGKELIEYFAQNLFDDQVLQLLFQSNFQLGHFNHESDRESFIVVDATHCFRKHRVEISLDTLWGIVENELKDRESSKKAFRANNEQFYYCYYFLLMAFRNPTSGLRKLDRISYNLEILTNLMFRLEQAIDSNNSLWAINCFHLFKSFLKGLLLIGVVRVKEANQSMKNIKADFKQQEENIEVIKNVLKEDKAKNKDLLDNIQRLEIYINATKATKKNEKELRFQKNKQQELDSKPKQVQPEAQPQILINDATMNLKTMRQMKYQFTQNSNLTVDYISEKEALQAIYARIFQEKQRARARQRREVGHGNNLFLTGLGVTHQREGATKQIVDKIMNDDLEGLGNINKQEVLSAIRSIYESDKKNFHQVVNLLDSLRIGDRKKLDIGRLCKIYQGDIPTQDLRHIFPFTFFLESQTYNEEEVATYAYAGISKVIQNLLVSKDNEYLRSIAILMGSILQSNAFIDQVYIDTLISIGQRYSFNQQTIIRVRVIMEVLSQNSPHVVKQNIDKIIHAFRDNIELKAIMKHELQSLIKQHFPKEAVLLQKIRSI